MNMNKDFIEVSDHYVCLRCTFAHALHVRMYILQTNVHLTNECTMYIVHLAQSCTMYIVHLHVMHSRTCAGYHIYALWVYEVLYPYCIHTVMHSLDTKYRGAYYIVLYNTKYLYDYLLF